MFKLNFFRSRPSFLLTGALVGLTLGACDLGPKMIGDETDGPEDCEEGAVKPAGDGCNTCTCSDGGWACTEIGCEGQTSASATDPGTTTVVTSSGASDTDPGTSTVGTSTSTGGVETDTGNSGDTESASDTDVELPAIPCEGEAVPLADLPTLMAYTQAQVPPLPDPTGTGTGTGGGEPEPGTVYVKLSNQSFACEAPTATLQCGGNWQLTLVIPPEYQSPGIYNLLGPNVIGVGSETGDEGNDCSFGGGSIGGTLEIFSVDDSTVEGRLCHVQHFFSNPAPALDGSFSAARCP